MLAPAVAASLFAVGCLITPVQGPSQSAKASPRDPFPLPKTGLVIQGGADGETRLDALLEEFSRVTDHSLLISKETQGILKVASTGLNRTLEVAREDVYFVVESILANNAIALERFGDREPWLLGVHSLTSGQELGSLRTSAVYVPSADLPAWKRHPAFLVTTIVDLPSTDVRTLSNSMRTMFTDANTQQIIPVGNSNALLLTGFASNVADMVEMLEFVEERSRLALEKAAKATPPVAPVQEPVAK